jgi:hypothetical protein
MHDSIEINSKNIKEISEIIFVKAVQQWEQDGGEAPRVGPNFFEICLPEHFEIDTLS